MPRTELQNEQIKKLTKDKILNATIDAFIENGYSKTRVDDICKKAKISHGLFYHYFKSKSEALISLVISGKKSLYIKLSSVDQNNSELVIKTFIDSLLDNNRDPKYIKLEYFYTTINIDENAIKDIKKYKDKIEKYPDKPLLLLLKHFESLKLAGKLRIPDANKSLYLLLSIHHGIVSLNYKNQDFKNKKINYATEDIMSLLIKGGKYNVEIV